MFKENVSSEVEALVYLTDCTLATVEGLALKKSASKNEFLRQCSMAQFGVSWIKRSGYPVASGRVKEVIDNSGSIKIWLKKEFPDAKHLDILPNFP